MIGCSLFWYESTLDFAQDIVFGKEVHKSGVHNITENLPQITVHTDALVIIRVKFVFFYKVISLQFQISGEKPTLRTKLNSFNMAD